VAHWSEACAITSFYSEPWTNQVSRATSCLDTTVVSLSDELLPVIAHTMLHAHTREYLTMCNCAVCAAHKLYWYLHWMMWHDIMKPLVTQLHTHKLFFVYENDLQLEMWSFTYIQSKCISMLYVPQGPLKKIWRSAKPTADIVKEGFETKYNGYKNSGLYITISIISCINYLELFKDEDGTLNSRAVYFKFCGYILVLVT
jgi:hypothetical protein